MRTITNTLALAFALLSLTGCNQNDSNQIEAVEGMVEETTQPLSDTPNLSLIAAQHALQDDDSVVEANILPAASISERTSQQTVDLPSVELSTGQSMPKRENRCDITDLSPTIASDGLPGIRDYLCVVDYVNVNWSVSVPEGCQSGGCGLIVDIHGATMNAGIQDAGTQMRAFGRRATDYGALSPYIVLQPNLTDVFDEYSGWDFQSLFGGAYSNEIKNLSTFTARAIEAWQVDQSRVHLMGFSRGTWTANVFYCDPDGLGAPFASTLMFGERLSCEPVDNKPLMVINGEYDLGQSATNDVIYKGLLNGGYSQEVLFNPDNWNVIQTRLENGVYTTSGSHQHIRLRKGQKWVELIEHSGVTVPLAGHCIPSTSPNNWLVCQTDFDLGQKAIAFFIAHTG
ncbi:MAG: hypothetical protein HWE20_14390 [Gammaproteobacteria bacterium]|nr:hypothetical protein [Gammaproteobacteria bacterium]